MISKMSGGIKILWFGFCPTDYYFLIFDSEPTKGPQSEETAHWVGSSLKTSTALWDMHVEAARDHNFMVWFTLLKSV